MCVCVCDCAHGSTLLLLFEGRMHFFFSLFQLPGLQAAESFELCVVAASGQVTSEEAEL